MVSIIVLKIYICIENKRLEKYSPMCDYHWSGIMANFILFLYAFHPFLHKWGNRHQGQY